MLMASGYTAMIGEVYNWGDAAPIIKRYVWAPIYLCLFSNIGSRGQFVRC